MKIKGYACSLLLSLAIGGTSAAAQTPSKEGLKDYAKALDIYGASMARLMQYYVDTVDVEHLNREAIDRMLQTLDPYTEYYSKEDEERLQMITTGAYGGIGAIISQRPDSLVIINEPMQGMPADRAGLKAGDIILEIDGKDHRRSTSELATKGLKGTPGSKVRILVQRPGEKKPRLFVFEREQVIVNPVSYYGKTPGGYGYISLNSFTNKASSELLNALNSLNSDGKLPGLILDLRGNGGGLMDEAIRIVDMFVPEGKVVVTVRGRAELRQEMTLKTKRKALFPDLPLIVLINGESASSSEIVSGALQDMDRAVIVGNKSFGKGLVQSTLSLPHNGILKLTTAKYYIPSGRCIQRIDYKNTSRGKTANVIPDSLQKVFYTAGGRPVRDAGGILPDVTVRQDSLATMLVYLAYNNDVFDWVTDYVRQRPSIASPKDFKLDDVAYASFGKMLEDKKFDYDRQSSASLKRLRDISDLEGYTAKAKALLDSLEQVLKPDLKHDLEVHRPEIERLLSSQIISRYYYRRGVAEREMQSDKYVSLAEEILKDKTRYQSILSPKKENTSEGK